MANAWSDSQVMMTLSGIAYYNDVRGQLKNPNYATANDWSVVWGPVVDWYGNRAYVASRASSPKYAIAIRGTDTNLGWDALVNMYEDLNVIVQTPWKYFPGEQGAMVSLGAEKQFRYLLSDATWDGLTLFSFIEKIPPQIPIAITGHSLGGNLAIVVGSFLSYVRGPRKDDSDLNTEVYSFAAPSPGNQAFAKAYNKRLPKSFRYWNARDIVPRAWDHLSELYHIYDSLGIATPEWIQNAIWGMQVALDASQLYYNSYYQQSNGDGTKLTNDLLPLTEDWLTEVIDQHAVNRYLGLLGAPPIASSATLARGGLNAAPPIFGIGVEEIKVPPALIAEISASALRSAKTVRNRSGLR